MKALSSAFLLVTAGAAFAQVEQNMDEQRIYNAYVRLRSFDSIFVQIKGTEWIGDHPKTFSDNLYWLQEPPSSGHVNKVELLEYVDDVPKRRVVADGRTLFTYDLERHEYSAGIYGSYGGNPNANYLQNMFALLNRSTRGQSSYAARLIREVYQPGGQPTYRSWAAGYQPFSLISPIQDPIILTRTYLPNGARVYVAYGTDNRNTNKSVVFQMDYDDAVQDYDLSAIYYSERTGSGRTARVVDWTMQIVTGLLQSPANFVPYTSADIAGWRPVVGAQPVKAG